MSASVFPRIVLVPCLALLALAPACARHGRCVGIDDPTLAHQRVLVNLDNAGAAIAGHDPVAYFTDAKPVKGDPTIRSTHAGALYYFASLEHKRMFDANPAKYEPEFGGYCAYAASINTISPIDPNYWEIVDGRLILQHNQRAWDAWKKDPAGNLVKADKNWPGLVERNGTPPRALLNVDPAGLALEGYDPTAYILDGKPRKGDPALARSFQGAMYYFVHAEHKNAFEKDPARFVPQFGGFCGYAASINKVSPVNPEIWQIVDGRVVLQHTPEAYRLFNENVRGNYAKAEKNWPGLSSRRCR
ncbi:MAG: YHS domain-containing (seleno)protein [Planctomycetota bacterium]|nr:YHS domain-containing (seleno)protein [Planctomycetota bacterium]